MLYEVCKWMRISVFLIIVIDDVVLYRRPIRVVLSTVRKDTVIIAMLFPD